MSTHLSRCNVMCANAVEAFCNDAVLRQQQAITGFATNTPATFTSGKYIVNGTEREIKILSEAEHHKKIDKFSTLYDASETVSSKECWVILSAVATAVLVASGIFLIFSNLIVFGAVALTGSLAAGVYSGVLHGQAREIRMAGRQMAFLLNELSCQHLARAQQLFFKMQGEEGRAFSNNDKIRLALEVIHIFGCNKGDTEAAERTAKSEFRFFEEDAGKAGEHSSVTEDRKLKNSLNMGSLSKNILDQLNNPIRKQMLENIITTIALRAK